MKPWRLRLLCFDLRRSESRHFADILTRLLLAGPLHDLHGRCVGAGDDGTLLVDFRLAGPVGAAQLGNVVLAVPFEVERQERLAVRIGAARDHPFGDIADPVGRDRLRTGVRLLRALLVEFDACSHSAVDRRGVDAAVRRLQNDRAGEGLGLSRCERSDAQEEGAGESGCRQCHELHGLSPVVVSIALPRIVAAV